MRAKHEMYICFKTKKVQTLNTEMGSPPNRDGNAKGIKDIMTTSHGVFITAVTALNNICNKRYIALTV